RLQDIFKKTPGAKASVHHITSVGSGFIIDASGFIVTNNHVVEGADKIEVSLNNGETLAAKLVGRDEKTDLALIKVQPKKPLPYAHFGDSNRARIGEWVIAIGNPFGLGSTVTAGIISARNRNIEIGDYDDFIQTDAPINKGNSGGPLFDMDGAVIGVNSAIFSPSGGSVGIGFAIPSNMVRDVVAQLRQFGAVHRGWVGMNVRQAENGGALVTGAASGGPAAQAGLRSGDVVTGYDGKRVSDSRDLARMVAMTAAGRSVMVEVMRGKARLYLRLTIQPYKTAPKAPPAKLRH
ncbi:MAG: trypsin-like peptidase domain-containing protein, partial [Rhizomicrobium sp.]